MGILTPYATGPSPIYFGSGYIKGKDFVAALIVIGVPWLRFLGI